MEESQDKNNPMADELPAVDAVELETKLAAAEKQCDEYLAGWQRAKADFVNYKKEELAHLQEVVKYGNEDLVKDMISVMDNFDLGLRALEKAGPVTVLGTQVACLRFKYATNAGRNAAGTSAMRCSRVSAVTAGGVCLSSMPR